MKKAKMIMKTLLFAAFMAVAISMAGDTVSLVLNPMENPVATYCEERPNVEPNESGY